MAHALACRGDSKSPSVSRETSLLRRMFHVEHSSISPTHSNTHPALPQPQASPPVSAAPVPTFPAAPALASAALLATTPVSRCIQNAPESACLRLRLVVRSALSAATNTRHISPPSPQSPALRERIPSPNAFPTSLL